MDWECFGDLPDESPLWVYGFDTELTEADEALVRQYLDSFLQQWATHGEPVRGAFQIVDKRFVLLAGYLPSGISGCSIDSSVRVFKELQQAGLDALDRSRVFFRGRDRAVHSAHFSEFQQEIDEGHLTPEGLVFDTNVNTLGQLRREGLEKPLTESWHGRTFQLSQAAAQQ